MKSIKIILLSLCLAFLASIAFSLPAQLGAWDASKPAPFKLPAKYQKLLKDYRTSWIRLTNLEFSGLHWNQGIVVYINKGHKVFANNYIEYLKIVEDLEDEDSDECDVGEKYIEDEDECVSAFEHYDVGTVVLKENFLLEKGIPTQPLTVTVMEKKADGWHYFQYDVNGSLLVDGKSKDPVVQKTCASCHQNMSDRDFIFASFYHRQEVRAITPPKKK